MEKNLKKGCQICQNHNGYDISGRIMNFGSINVENNSDSVGVLREPDIQTGAVKTVTSETKPLLPEYYEIGDKYLDLILENPVNTQVLVNLSALQDIYEAGEGIDIQNRIITNTKTTTWGEIAGTLLDQTDLTNALALKCNADLSNMPNSFWQKLHVILALKTGEISADSELLVWIEDMYYSTFDKSKFTIVGSPNITDDGVASGFSDSNKISIQNPFNNFNKIVFNIKFEANKTGVLLSGFTQTPSTFNPMYIYKSSETTVNFVWRNSSASNVINEQFTGINANATKYKFVLDTNSNILTLYVDDVFYDSKSVTTTNLMKDFNTFYIGSTDGTSNFTGSIDLKGVGVNADGVPVFSGNKTGVDTIKPDDYTPEGSIASTITADGIVSGFSGSNYLTLPYQYSDNVINYVEKITFTTASDVTTRQPIRGINENANKGIGITINSGKMNYRIGTGTSWQQADSAVSVSTNTTYTVEFTQTSTTTTFKLYSENGTLLDTTSVNHVNLLYAEIVLGTNKIWSNEYFRGSIDLKEYKIYLDGQLVYIPYLQIPYTESKTGSKIVDSAYRELVNYMASQFGFAPYYTLSDTDFTLPMGEVYGFIGKNSADIKMLGAEKADKTALDDEWIYADETGDANLISTDYAIGTYDVNLSSILPSDGKIYECIFCYCISRNDNSNDNTTYKVTSNGHKVLEDNIDGRGGSSSDNKQHGGQFTAIVGLERKLQLSIINHVLHNGDTCMYISAYRKLGTN